MSVTTYAEKLQHPNWQKKRLLILQRDNFTCQYCQNKSQQLQIHHLKYLNFNDPADTPDEFLITCCKHCHYIIEDLKKAKTTVLKIHNRNNKFYRVYAFSKVFNSKMFIIYEVLKEGLNVICVLKFDVIKDAFETLSKL